MFVAICVEGGDDRIGRFVNERASMRGGHVVCTEKSSPQLRQIQIVIIDPHQIGTTERNCVEAV